MKDRLSLKHEDVVNGKAVGPMVYRNKATDKWYTAAQVADVAYLFGVDYDLI
jgi:hypothetical protein